MTEYRFRLTFRTAFAGPLCLGHSWHFGLGLFVPTAERRAYQESSETESNQ
jgi:hypothetical protein